MSTKPWLKYSTREVRGLYIPDAELELNVQDYLNKHRHLFPDMFVGRIYVSNIRVQRENMGNLFTMSVTGLVVPPICSGMKIAAVVVRRMGHILVCAAGPAAALVRIMADMRDSAEDAQEGDWVSCRVKSSGEHESGPPAVSRIQRHSSGQGLEILVTADVVGVGAMFKKEHDKIWQRAS